MEEHVRGYEACVLDAASSMVAYWDSELCCRYANRAYERWFGISPAALMGRSIRDLLGPELFQLNEPYIRGALSGELQVFERAVPGPDGTSRQSLARYTPHRVDGIVAGFIVEVTDVQPLKDAQRALELEIHDRERAARLLIKSESALQVAQRLGGIGSWHWEIASGIMTWSTELYRIFGCDPTLLPPHYEELRRFFFPTSWLLIDAAVDAALRDGTPYGVDLEFWRDDGSSGWLEAHGRVERDDAGRIMGLHGTAQDITERRQLTSLIQAAHVRCRLATEAARLGIWRWESGDDALSWENDRARDLFEVDASDRATTLTRWLRTRVVLEDASRFAAAFDQARRNGVDFRFVGRINHIGRADLRWIEMVGRIEGRDLADATIIGTVGDITGLMTERLAVERMRAELDERDARRLEFLAVLGHEQKNLLTPLRMGLDLLRVAKSADKVERMYQTASRQLTHLSLLVDDLLDLRRVDSGQIRLDCKPLDLGDVVDLAVDATRGVIEARKHKLAIARTDDPLIVHGDELRLCQVLSNLLLNASKFTPPGGEIEVSQCKGLDGLAHVRVRDTGVGIEADAINSIFELYAQVRTGDHPASAGIGVGLHLVQRLTELHGGSIEVFSDGAGLGSSFTVRLPICTVN